MRTGRSWAGLRLALFAETAVLAQPSDRAARNNSAGAAGGTTAVGAIRSDAEVARARALLWGAFAGRRRLVLPAAAMCAVHQGAEASVPLAIGIVVDRAIAPGDATGLLWSLVGLAALFAVLTSSMRLGGRLAKRAAQGAEHDLRLALTARVLAPRGFPAAAARSGELLSLATSDAARVGMINTAIWFGTGAVAAILVAAVILFGTSVPLGLLVLAGLVPVVVLSRLIAAPLVRRSGAEQAAAARAAGTAADLMSGLRVLRGIGAEREAAARYRHTSDLSRDAAVRAARLAALRTAAVIALTGLFVAVVAFIAGRMALQDRITVGEFVTAVTLTQFLIGPFAQIARTSSMAARARASAHRLATALDAPPVVNGGGEGRLPAGEGGAAVTTTGLVVGGLGPLDLDIRPGQCVGLVLPDETAAAELLDFLGRRADPATGRVALNGVATTELAPEDVRATVLVAEHDGVLFGGTLAENVAAVARDDRAVAAAMECAAADEVAASLPHGADSAVGEAGRLLSGGQRQRVALARALAADPPVLVLHEPTTAVDSVTESRIAARLAQLRAGRTTLVITGSPALLAAVDRVVIIEEAGVTGTGTHSELLRTHPTYREAVLA